MVPDQEIATREKQQVQGNEQTRPGRYFMPDVDIRRIALMGRYAGRDGQGRGCDAQGWRTHHHRHGLNCRL